VRPYASSAHKHNIRDVVSWSVGLGTPMDKIHENFAYSYSYPYIFKGTDISADIIHEKILDSYSDP
jgi:hypothetical protein